MAIAYGTGWSNSTPSTSLVITIAPAAQDFLVGIVCDDFGSGTITWPAPWVQLPTYSTVADGATVSVAYLANATGSETSVTISSTNPIMGGITSFTGVDNGNPLDVPIVRSIADSAFPSPWLINCGIQPANDGAMLVALMNSDGEDLNTVHTFADSGGLTWTTRLDLTDGTFLNVGIGTALQSTAAATLVTGTGTIATDIGAPSMTLFALRPSGASGTRAIPYVNVSAQGSTEGGGATTSVTPGVTTTATGSTFLVFDQSTSSTGVTDSKGNTYSLIATVNGTGRSIHVWECVNGLGGSNHTTTVAYSSSGSRTHTFVEVVGAGARNILTSANDTSSPFSLTTATLATQPQLVLFHASSDGTGQLGETSGFQILGRTEDSATFWADAWGQKRVTATTALTPSFTSTGAAEGSLIVLSYQVGIDFPTQPLNQTVRQGSTATFTLAATGTGSLTYQWQDDSAGWANVTGGTGATTNSYTTAATTSAFDSRKYRCVVTAGDGSVKSSNEVSLDVNTAGTYADFDADLRIATWFDKDSILVSWFDNDFVDVDGDVTTPWFVPTSSAGDASGPAFSSLDSMRVSDDARATVTLGASATSEGFFVWSFDGLAVPSGKTIKGIEVRVEGSVTAGSLASNTILLVNANTFTPTAVESKSLSLTGSEALHILGDAADKWGGVDADGGSSYDRDWLPADLNTADFGVYGFFTAGGSGATVSLDSIQLRVTYGAGGTVVAVPVLAFTETLPVPKINESISVPGLSFTETLVVPNIVLSVAVAALAFTETLPVPKINEAISVPALSFTATLAVPKINEAISVPALSYVETLLAPVVNERVVVPVPPIATLEVLPVPKINEAISVPALSIAETLVVPKLVEPVNVPSIAFAEAVLVPVINEAINVPALSFVETLPDPTAGLSVQVPGLSFTETVPVPNLNDSVGVASIAFEQTLLEPTAGLSVQVPALTFIEAVLVPLVNESTGVPAISSVESLVVPNVNESISVPPISFVETLAAPSVVVTVAVPAISFVEALLEPTVGLSVEVPVLGFAEALSVPSINESITVPALSFVETVVGPYINDVVGISALAFNETLVVPSINESISVPSISSAETLPVPKINESISVPVMTFNEVLFAPDVFEDENLAVEVLSFVQTLVTPSINESISVPALTFVETVVVPSINEAFDVSAATFVQTFLVPNINELISVQGQSYVQTLLIPTLTTFKVVSVTVQGNTQIGITVLGTETIGVAVPSNKLIDVNVLQ